MPYNQYFNGKIFPIETALYQTNDLGILRGYGLFDYFRTYNGIPFRWNDYWQRFENSARLLRLPLPLNQQEASRILADLFTESQQADVAFRFVLTGGYAADSMTVVSPNLLIRTEPLSSDNLAAKVKGIKVLPYEYVRDLPEVKSTNYIHLILMADEMRRQQASDLLYYKNSEVSELTRSNIFIVKGNTLTTPGKNILHGITRRVILELAAPHFDIQVRRVLLEELLQADEVFTTSSTKGVMPIIQVGSQMISTGEAGSHTLYLQSLFDKLVLNWNK